MVGTTSLRFNILGPLEGWAGGVRLELGGLIQKRILAALLLDAGKLLTVSRLIASAWDEDPPATASHQVRKAVADLRRRIPGGKEFLATEGPGYAVDPTVSLDVTEFDQQVREAKRLTEADRTVEAVNLLREALALWRGPVLTDVGGALIEAAALALEERHMAALEFCFELRLAHGDTADLVADLRLYTGRHPLQEPLRAQLVRALYLSGRRAEALEEYARAREVLAEELGIDPGPQLAELHGRILRDEMDPPPTPPTRIVPAPPVAVAPAPPVAEPDPPPLSLAPRTLPPDVAEFVGRGPELQMLLDHAQPSDQRTRIIAIDGMAGAGKTSLAIRAAYRLAARYTDGQLYIDLAGYTPGERPMTASAALEQLLRALGVPGASIPDDVTGRMLLWRASLAGKRILVLLDNAAELSVVGRLMPTHPGCLVLVTGRVRMTELDGAEWISIDVLPPDDSESLITALLGAQWVRSEPEAVTELARLCGHLPLALRIAAARLRNRRLWTIRYLVERLQDEDRKLRELSSGERGVASTLLLSYQALPEGGRHAFLLLAIHPGREIDVFSAAAMLDLDTADAEDHLERLLDAHLVRQPAFERYAYHDLVASFARGNLGLLPEGRREAAVERLVAYYVTVTESACELLFPGRTKRPTGIAPLPTELPRLREADDAQSWFGRERLTLIALIDMAVREGLHKHAVVLTRNVSFYLNASGNLDEYAEIGRIAVAAARHLGDDELLGVSLSNLGLACWKLGLYEEGMAVVGESLELAERVGDQRTQAHSQGTLGLYQNLLGNFPEALEHLRTAIDLERSLGLRRAEAENLTVLSTLYEQWGRWNEAAEAAEEAVALIRKLGRHESALVALTDLAAARLGLGDIDVAEQCLAEARLSCDESREPGQVALTMALSAEVAFRLGETERATRYAEQAWTTAARSSSPQRRAKVGNMLGRLRHGQADFAAALHLHAQAREMAVSVRFRIEEAYALAGMAAAAAALGDRGTAAAHSAAAEDIFRALGVPADCRRGRT